MDIQFRLCIGDVPVPVENVDAETLGGIKKGYLLNLSQRGNYKWLEKAFELSNKKQKHRFYRGGGAKNFKILEEMRAAIIEMRKVDKKIPFIEAVIRGHRATLQNNLKSVRVFLPHDTVVEELSWVSENLIKDIEETSEGITENEHQDSEEPDSDQEPQDPQEQPSFEAIAKEESSTIVSETQRHTGCFSINWRPSRMAFLVKRNVDDDGFEAQEFYIKRPTKLRKNLDKNEPSAGETLKDVFKSCHKNIQHWLDKESDSDQSLPDPQVTSRSS